MIDTRTAEAETRTLIAVRHQDGRLGLYYHGAMHSSEMLPPPCTTRLSHGSPCLRDTHVLGARLADQRQGRATQAAGEEVVE